MLLESTMGKTCILLEDVDILFEEDKGFWNAIQAIIETSKCPIILTCSGKRSTVENSVDHSSSIRMSPIS